MNKIFFISLLFSFYTCNLKANNFSIPKILESSVVFWENVYSLWDINQVIFHDNQDLSIIYYILDLPKVSKQLSAQKYPKEVQNKRKEISQILDDIFNKKKIEKKSELYEKIEDILEKNNLLQEPNLKDRLRFQSGLKSQFSLGLEISGRYIKEMKAILRAQGLPEGLIAIPFVESLFSMNVVSHAGAGGPWGIMRETGRLLGIHINNFVDERFDPLLSTMAASAYLKRSKEELHDWGLAITSYNYGFSGMLRAVNNLGSKDFEVIIKNHQSPIFGFACKNYYAEFLAALNIIENIEKYFPKIELEKPWEYEFVEIARPVHVDDLKYFRVISEEVLRRLNPSIKGRAVPSKYSFRVPIGQANSFYENIKKIPGLNRKKAGELVDKKYRANGRETIYKIALKNGVDADFLANRMGQDLDYKPKGTVMIRTGGFKFSSLINIAKDIVSEVNPEKIIKKNNEQ